MHLVVLGGSYTGRRLARRFPEHRVLFLTRTPGEMRREGFDVLGGDTVCDRLDAVVDTIPALMDGGQLQDPPYLSQVDRLLSRFPEASLIHISSTSVYPQTGPSAASVRGAGGAAVPAVDESTPAKPDSDRGRRRLELESRWAQAFPQVRILRSAGIYGPGRCLAERFRRGDFSRTGNGNRVVSRIHVDDLCRMILAMAARGEKAPKIVHGVDRRPAPYAEVFEFCEDLLGIRVPGDWREAPATGRAVVSLYAESLIGDYLFPTYQEGFRDCLLASQA